MNIAKYLFGIFQVSAILLVLVLTVSAQEVLLPAPEGFSDLLHVNERGGRIIRPQNFELIKPGAEIQNKPNARLVYEQTYSDFGSYRLELDVPGTLPQPGEAAKTTGRQELRSVKSFSVKPNRNYIVSVLVKTDFDRNACEFNVYLRLIRNLGLGLTPRHTLGLPAVTEGIDGWQRLEWMITTPSDPRIKGAKAALDFTAKAGEKVPQMRIADYVFVELPAEPLQPLPRGEGVVFPGGAGELPMNVESHSVKNGYISVITTGAKYEIDTENNIITASQRIEFPRELAKWQSSLSLKNLRIDQQTEDVCVLSNDQLTIGIQRDSLMVISPQRELQMTLTNLLGGDFNRYARGYLYSTDDFGGITVDPYVPPGTGLEPQSELLTKGLSFEKLSSEYTLQHQKKINEQIDDPWSSEELGAAESGWQARWTTRPGEFFTTSVFPPRPYDWEKSFTEGRRTYSAHQNPLEDKDIFGITNWTLWDHIPKMFGHSYSDYYEPENDAEFRKLVADAHARNIGILPYMSAYWTPTRDPNRYIDGVRQFKEKYGIDGVYSDGLPSADWLVAYKEMRMLRELFPSGYIAVHNSIQQAGWEIAQQKPFLYTYATSVSMTEGVYTRSGPSWQYPRYFTAQFRKSNNFGKTLGGKWYFPDGQSMKDVRNLVTLVYNGRDDVTGPKYREVLEQLYQLWKEKGDQPFFYDRYYLPRVQELTGQRIGRAAMPIIEKEEQGSTFRITLRTLTPGAKIYYTTDGALPTKNSLVYTKPFELNSHDIMKLKARSYSPELDPSAVAIEVSDLTLR